MTMNALNAWKKDKKTTFAKSYISNYYSHTVITSQKNGREIEHQKQPSRGAFIQRSSENLVFTKN